MEGGQRVETRQPDSSQWQPMMSSNEHRKNRLHLTKNLTWDSPALEISKTQPDKTLSNFL